MASRPVMLVAFLLCALGAMLLLERSATAAESAPEERGVHGLGVAAIGAGVGAAGGAVLALAVVPAISQLEDGRWPTRDEWELGVGFSVALSTAFGGVISFDTIEAPDEAAQGYLVASLPVSLGILGTGVLASHFRPEVRSWLMPATLVLAPALGTAAGILAGGLLWPERGAGGDGRNDAGADPRSGPRGARMVLFTIQGEL